jgi:DeoR family transcriptional regulator, fructose operon transcriptional repressor
MMRKDSMAEPQANANAVPDPGTAFFVEERRRAILERLQSTGKVTVEDLAASFRVSYATVRADLARLEGEGLLRRTHGGAILASATLYEPAYAHRQVIRLPEKQVIARPAAAMVRDGETVLLDAGTTTHEVALQLCQRQALTVVTNSLSSALVLMENPGIEVVMLGGTVNARRRATLGPLAVGLLDAFRVDRAFLAFNGIHRDAGFTVVDFDAASLKRRMAERAAQVIVVADSGKIGQIAFAAALPLSAAHTLVTDAGISETDRAALSEQGLHVIVAK